MTKIDFYILSPQSHRTIEQLSCQLTEKAYIQNNFVYIQCQSIEQSNQLDELLWKHKPSSFLPHINLNNYQIDKIETSADFSYPILINSSETTIEEPLSDDLLNQQLQIKKNYNADNKSELLINLSNHPAEFFSSFQRLIEVINKDSPSKQTGRERYRYYKERGYEISIHNV